MKAISQAVILASGLGKRLSHITGGIPKCFFNFSGNPLIIYPIKALKNAGVDNFIIIVPQGFKKEAIKIVSKELSNYIIVENSAVNRGNAYSLLLAEEYAQDIFILSCADSIYPKEAVISLIKNQHSDFHVMVAASQNTRFIDIKEASKIKVRGSKILEIGKHLKEYDYIDTGLFAVKKEFFSIKHKLNFSEEREMHLHELMNISINYGYKLTICNLSDIPWTEVDTEEDLEKLKELFTQYRQTFHFL